jgi:hypothetical protein
MEDQPQDTELVMPFVVCASQGGPYDDDAFVAGFQAGSLYKTLAAIAAVEATGVIEVPVRTALLPQLDLIAMKFGFTTEAVPAESPDWSMWSAVRVP